MRNDRVLAPSLRILELPTIDPRYISHIRVSFKTETTSKSKNSVPFLFFFRFSKKSSIQIQFENFIPSSSEGESWVVWATIE